MLYRVNRSIGAEFVTDHAVLPEIPRETERLGHDGLSDRDTRLVLDRKAPDGARDVKVLQSILTSIEALQLKPRKGRLKDIRQIHAVVKKMHDKLCSRQ